MPVPSEDAWRAWDFLSRMDWAAREVARHGRRLPDWAVAFHFGRWVLQQIVFGLILWAAPTADADAREHTWKIIVRYAIFCHLLESFGWRHGPMCGGRVTPWPLGCFTNARYRLTRGTFRYTGNPLVRHLLGDRRTVHDVLAHVFFLVSSVAAVAVPEHLPWATVCAAIGALWVWVIDQPQSTDGKGTTYVHFILAGCFPAAHGGAACAQLQLLIVWIASGICKLGPWMEFVNGPLLGGSIWFRGREWIWRLLYRGEDDLRPTLLSGFISKHASHVEWVCPLMLLFPCQPVAVYAGLALLVAMHVYIMANAGLDVFAWNGFFIVAGPCLFGSRALFGLDYAGLRAAHPLLLTWYFLEAAVIVFGWFRPGGVSFQAGHRNWAGNEPAAVVLLSRGAASKLTAAFPIIGRPIWDPVPPELRGRFAAAAEAAAQQPHAAEMSAFKILSAYWLGLLSLKVLPALVQQALAGREIADFHVMNHFQFWDMLWGAYFFCPTHLPEVLRAVQRSAQFDEGECLCVCVDGFPVAGPSWGGARWRILDARRGVIAQGEASLETAASLAALPSACARAGALLLAR